MCTSFGCKQLHTKVALLIGAVLFYNATVALPMSLSLLRDRLENSYYRQTQGFVGDVETMASNAKNFNGDDSPVGLAAAGEWPACTALAYRYSKMVCPKCQDNIYTWALASRYGIVVCPKCQDIMYATWAACKAYDSSSKLR